MQENLSSFVRLETKAERDEVLKGYFRSVSSRVNEGICVSNLFFQYEQIGGGYVYQFKGGNTFQFGEGDLVILNQGTPEGDAVCDGILMWVNEINYFDRSFVLEKAAEVPDDREPPRDRKLACTLDKGFSDLNSGRLLNSIRIAFEERPDLKALLMGERIIEQLRANVIYLPGFDARPMNSTSDIDLNRKSINAEALCEANKDDTAGFTERQVAAFERAFSHPLSLVQGPPGTGKTRLLGQIILKALRERKRILVSAYTHAAIDNLLEAIAALKPPPGSLLKIQGRNKSKSLPRSVDQMIFNATELAALLEFPIIIGATVYQTYRMHQAKLPAFDLVVIDEAGQLPIPHALAAMICGDHYILAGDHKQLPPIIKAHEPDEDVAKSIFERLHDVYPKLNIELDVTFRMNSEINDFPSQAFYSGRLKPAPHAAQRTFMTREMIDDGDPIRTSYRQIINRDESVTFVDLPHSSCVKMSKPEAEAAAQLAHILLTEHGVPPSELAIISPHRQHNAEIRRRLARLLNNTPGWASGSTLKQLSVDTVEKMQGRERDVVILSLCASKKSYLQARAQFLYKPNRLNVAITRSRTRLFVLASKLFFPSVSQVRLNPKNAKIFNDYYVYLQQRQVVIDAPD